MTDLPTHKTAQISDYGIFLKAITPSSAKRTITYSHRDDYYIFGLIDEGECCLSIDFKEYHISKGETIFIQPGQVHHSISANNLTAHILIIDSAFVSDMVKDIFDDYSMNLSSFQLTEQQQAELRQIFLILTDRMDRIKDKQAKEIIHNLSAAFVGIIAEAAQTINHVQPIGNKRQKEIMLSFHKLLKEEFQINKRPSYYASRLNISCVYLNEVIKSVTGMSASRYIQHEVMLQAKRMLFYTSKSIQEVAIKLGFSDYAYFTKLFTKVIGTNPTSFRKKNLE